MTAGSTSRTCLVGVLHGATRTNGEGDEAMNDHIHSVTRCAHDAEGPTVWWLCGFAPMSTNIATAFAATACSHLAATVIDEHHNDRTVYQCDACESTFRIVTEDGRARMVAAMVTS